MIRLTVSSSLLPYPHLYLFEACPITIGSPLESTQEAASHLPLPHPSLPHHYLEITEQGGFAILINCTHDPSIYVNGHRFDKKLLNSGDLLSIQQTTILFERISNSRQDGDCTSTTKSENECLPHEEERSHLYQAWKWLLLFIFSICTTCGLVGAILYVSLNDRKGAQEIAVAQGVADIAMALAYAQLHHLRPPHDNWSDVDFLRHHLRAILVDHRSYASQVDAQGKFHCCPYHLRLYTDHLFSRFIVIAQPTPHVLNWIIPQAAVVLDSRTMELRSVSDVRALNRLLAMANPLEGLNGMALEHLIQQGILLPLSRLTTEWGSSDFLLPRAVTENYPEARNLIYNAPRYYRIGQSLLERAVQLSRLREPPIEERAKLQREVDRLASLPHLLLYSDKGRAWAALATQGIRYASSPSPILIGYLLFDSHGHITEAHLPQESIAAPLVSVAHATHPHSSSSIHTIAPYSFPLAVMALLEQRASALSTTLSSLERLLEEKWNEEGFHAFTSLIESYLAQEDVLQKEIELQHSLLRETYSTTAETGDDAMPHIPQSPLK